MGRNGTESSGLHRDVPQRGRLHGAGDHLDAQGVGGELVQQGVAAASADDVQTRRQGEFGESAGGVQLVAVGLGERFKDAAHQLGGGARVGAAPLRSVLVVLVLLAGDRAGGGHDPIRHLAGREEGRIGGVDPEAAARDRRGGLQQITEVDLRALVLPLPDRFADQPHPGHVLEDAERVVDAALIREAGREGRPRGDRAGQLEPDEGPGARGDVGDGGVLDRGRRRGRGRQHRRRGVMGADGDHRDLTDAEHGGELRADRAQLLARCDQGRQQRAVHAGCLQELGDPLPGGHRQHPGGRGVGELRAALAGEQVADEVGHHQQRAACGQLREAVVGQQLVDRVEGLLGDPGERELSLPGDLPRELVGDPVGAGIPIGDHLAEALAGARHRGAAGPDRVRARPGRSPRPRSRRRWRTGGPVHARRRDHGRRPAPA